MDRLSETFQALADPTRRAILARLTLGETSVNELAEPFAMSLPAVSKHLKVLERAGLIWRPRRSKAWMNGWMNIAASGKRASTASMPISKSCSANLPNAAMQNRRRP